MYCPGRAVKWHEFMSQHIIYKAVHVYIQERFTDSHRRWYPFRWIANSASKSGQNAVTLESLGHTRGRPCLDLFILPRCLYGSIKWDDFMGFLCPAWEFYCTCPHCIQLITEVPLKRSIAPVCIFLNLQPITQAADLLYRFRVMVTYIYEFKS